MGTPADPNKIFTAVTQKRPKNFFRSQKKYVDFTMRIVELTGQPCAGKSNFARYCGEFSDIVLFDRDWLLGALNVNVKSKALGHAAYEIFMLYGGARRLRIAKMILILRHCIKYQEGLYRKLNVFRNILHKYAIYEFADRVLDDRYLVIDEGISHIPFLFAGSSSKVNPKVLIRFSDYFPWIIKISTDKSLLKQRLADRGHKQLDASKVHIDDFIRQNEEISELQDQIFEDYDRLTGFFMTDETDACKLFKQMIQKFQEANW